MTPSARETAWAWLDPAAAAALRSRELGRILRAYRRAAGLSQARLADRLGYDASYISMLETGRRTVRDLAARRHIARTLAVPPHYLGVTDPADDDHQAMVGFAESAVRLAETVRAAGRAAEAIDEVWSVVARLEALATSGSLEPEVLALLSRARTSLGVCLGTVLPEERLHGAVEWTRQGMTAARQLRTDRPGLWSKALQMHGNELRKVGQDVEAVRTLRLAVDAARSDEHRGTALALLARSAGQAGDAALFAWTRRSLTEQLRRRESTSGSPLCHPSSWMEIQLRGMLDLGQPAEAVRMADGATAIDQHAPTPQWSVIAGITLAAVELAAGDGTAAGGQLRAALDGARRHELPHQAQRIARLALAAGDEDLVHDSRAVAGVLGRRVLPGSALVLDGGTLAT